METGEKLAPNKKWSVISGEEYSQVLHLPSNAVLERISNPDPLISTEAKVRIVAGGAIISVLDLLHPDLQNNSEESRATLREMHQETGKSIMYTSRLSHDQKAEIFNMYKDLQLIKPASATALKDFIDKGLDIEAGELAEFTLMVMAIKETNPDAKLPTPILHKD